MTDPIFGRPAIGWELCRSSYKSPGGRRMKSRYVRIMLIDHFLITGEGVFGDRMRYYVEQFPTAEHARRQALQLTKKRERAGYGLVIDPITKPVNKEGTLEWLGRLSGKKAEPSAGLHDSFKKLFASGTKLEDTLSPEVSPAV